MVTKKDKHLAAAQKYMERGSFEKALAEFQNAVKEDPKDTRTWLRMAEVHVRLGRTDKATEVYQKTVDLYVEQGFFQRAVAVYKNIIKLSPDLVDARVKLADVYRQLGLLSDSAQQLEQATLLLQKANRSSEALAVIRQIIDLNPDQPQVRIRFAELAAQTGAVKDAATEFREAALLLKAQSRWEEWVRVVERLLQYEPDHVEIVKELAGRYLDDSNPKAALARLRPVFEKEPKNTEILELLARAFEQLDQPNKCLTVLRELLRAYADAGRASERNQTAQRILLLDSNDKEALAWSGTGTGDRARSMSSVGGMRLAAPPAIAKTPSTPAKVGSPERPFAITFSEMEVPPNLRSRYSSPPPEPQPTSISEKIDIATGLVERGEDDPEVMRILAEADVFVKYGLVERAADHLRRVFERVPSHPGAHERLAVVLAQLGRSAEASTEYETLAQQVMSQNPHLAATYAHKALDLNTNARRAREILRVIEGGLPATPPPKAAMPTLPQAEADSFELSMNTPEPEIIESGEIELIAGESMGAETLTEDEVAAESDQTYTRFDIAIPPEEEAQQSNSPESTGRAEPKVSERWEESRGDFLLSKGFMDGTEGDGLSPASGSHPMHPDRTYSPGEFASVPTDQALKGAMPVPHEAVSPMGASEFEGAYPMTKAVGESEPDLDTRADLGIMEKTMERYESAIQHFSALFVDPKREVFALTMIGECREAMGEFGEAIRCYQEALKRPSTTEPEATQIYFQLGSVFQTLGDRSEALYYFERVSKRDPSFRDVQRRLSGLKSRAGAG